MKAAIYEKYGPPEVVTIREVNKPIPKDNEVLIRIHAATVNRTDCGFRSAQYFVSRFFSGLFKPNQQILGNEFAGEIEAIGQHVTWYKVGENVFGYDDINFGSHAEYKTMPENGTMALLPNNHTYAESVALTEGAHYALNNIRAAKVQSGDDVLVNGATGAIGSAAVQLLKYYGAQVTAVCNTKNIELIKSLGADKIYDYQKEDFTSTDQKFDFIFDAVGKSSFRKCKPLLKEKGIYISTELGKHSANIFLAIRSKFKSGKKVLFPIPSIKREDLLFIKGLAEANKFTPVIDRQYTLDTIVDAYRYVETREKTGNVIIQI